MCIIRFFGRFGTAPNHLPFYHKGFLRSPLSFLLVVLLAACGTGSAEEYDEHLRPIGLDLKAAMHPDFPCDGVVGVVKQRRLTVAVLYETFGNSHHCLTKLIKDGDTVIWQMMNGPCRRNNRCGEGELLPHLSVSQFNDAIERRDSNVLGAIEARLNGVIQHKKGYPNATHYLVPELEDNLTDAAFFILSDTIQKMWKGIVIRNPVYGVSKAGADWIETHNEFEEVSVPCLYSNDGRMLSEGAFLSYPQCVKLMWTPEFNCLTDLRFKPIRERRCTIGADRLSELEHLSKIIF